MSATAPLPAAGTHRATAARSALWSVAENGGLALISFSSLIIYSRFLSVSDFGLFSIVLAVIELLTVLVSMLFHDALVQRPDIGEAHYDSAFTATLALSALLMAACWLGAPTFAARTGNPSAAMALAWTSLCLPLTAVSATIVARQRRNLDFRTLAVRSLVGRTLGAVAGIALVVAGFSFWGLVAQQVLVVLFGSAVLWLTCRERPRLRFHWQPFRELIGFGVVAVSVLFINFSIKRIFVILSGMALGTHAAGLLNLSFRAVDTFWSLAASAISQVALPILSALRADDSRFKRAFHTASAFACVVLYFCFVLIGALSVEVVDLLFGPRWTAIAPFVTLLSLQVLVQARRLLMAPMLTALGRPRDLLVTQTVELVFVLVAILASGVPSIGWAIGIWVVRECLGGTVQTALFRRASGIGLAEQLRVSLMPMLCAGAMLLAVWTARGVLPATWPAMARLAVLAPLGTAVYAGCLFLFDRQLLWDLGAFGRAALARRRKPPPALDNALADDAKDTP